LDIAPQILICPDCGGPLVDLAEGWSCASCEVTFSSDAGTVDFLSDGANSITVSEREHYTDKLDYYLQMHQTWCGSPFYMHYHGAFLDDLRALPRGALILELGGGLGHDGLELLKSGYRLVETDVAPAELGEARRLQQVEGYGDSVAHLLADGQQLPFAEGTFDGVMMAAALHHMPDPLRCLREARRVLKEGGLLVLGTEPNTWQHKTIFPLGKLFLKLLYRVMGKQADPGEMVSEADKETEGFSRADLERLFRAAGFNSWELKSAGFFSAAFFFMGQEISEHIGGTVRLFTLERLGLVIDEWLERHSMLRRYPWHWNAVAS